MLHAAPRAVMCHLVMVLPASNATETPLGALATLPARVVGLMKRKGIKSAPAVHSLTLATPPMAQSMQLVQIAPLARVQTLVCAPIHGAVQAMYKRPLSALLRPQTRHRSKLQLQLQMRPIIASALPVLWMKTSTATN